MSSLLWLPMSDGIAQVEVMQFDKVQPITYCRVWVLLSETDFHVTKYVGRLGGAYPIII